MRTQHHQQTHRITPTLAHEHTRSEHDACEGLALGAERFSRARTDEHPDACESFDFCIPADWGLV
jgi:hypothetical protein